MGKQKSKEVELLPIHDLIDAALGGETTEGPEPWLMVEDSEVMEALEDQEEGSDEQVERLVKVAEEGEDAASSEPSFTSKGEQLCLALRRFLGDTVFRRWHGLKNTWLRCLNVACRFVVSALFA